MTTLRPRVARVAGVGSLSCCPPSPGATSPRYHRSPLPPLPPVAPVTSALPRRANRARPKWKRPRPGLFVPVGHFSTASAPACATNGGTVDPSPSGSARRSQGPLWGRRGKLGVACPDRRGRWPDRQGRTARGRVELGVSVRDCVARDRGEHSVPCDNRTGVRRHRQGRGSRGRRRTKRNGQAWSPQFRAGPGPGRTGQGRAGPFVGPPSPVSGHEPVRVDRQDGRFKLALDAGLNCRGQPVAQNPDHAIAFGVRRGVRGVAPSHTFSAAGDSGSTDRGKRRPAPAGRSRGSAHAPAPSTAPNSNRAAGRPSGPRRSSRTAAARVRAAGRPAAPTRRGERRVFHSGVPKGGRRDGAGRRGLRARRRGRVAPAERAPRRSTLSLRGDQGRSGGGTRIAVRVCPGAPYRIGPEHRNHACGT